MDRNVFSYANAFFFKGGVAIYMAQYWRREEGQGNHFSSPGECLQPVTTQKQSMFVNKDRLGGKGEKKCLPPPKATFFPMAAQHSQLSQDHRPEMQTQVEGWDVSEGERQTGGWRLLWSRAAVLLSSLKSHFSTLHPSHTHRWTHTCTHTNVLTYQHTARQSSTAKTQRTSQSPWTFILKLVNDIHPTIMMWICSGRRKERWKEKRYSLDLPWERTSAQALGSVKMTRTQLQIFRSPPRFCCKGVTIFGILIQHLALCEFCSQKGSWEMVGVRDLDHSPPLPSSGIPGSGHISPSTKKLQVSPEQQRQMMSPGRDKRKDSM